MDSVAQDREERLKAEYELGTKAFRVVFDMRKALWPPEDTDEYWRRVWVLTKESETANPGNRMLLDLMTALYWYLEETIKAERGESI